MNNNQDRRFMKVNLFISKYLLYALPVAIVTVVWSLYMPKGGNELVEGFKAILWDILGYHFIIWFLLLIYFLLTLFIYVPFRERILTILTFSKERDERESYISGRASKATFYSTLGALILLFFLSGLNINIHKKAKDEVPEGKNRGSITIAYQFEFISTEKKIEQEKGTIIKYSGIPLSQESIILFLIMYHIASYHIFSRLKLKREMV